jgi:hypothetical protein
VPMLRGSTPSRRRWWGAVAAVGVVAALSGCSDTSFDAQTNDVYDPGAGSNARGGGVDVLNALVVDNGDGTGTLSATLILNPGEFDNDVELSTVTMDQLEVTTLDDEPIEATLADGSVPLEPNEPVQLGTEPLAWVSGENFVAGDMVTLSVAFDAQAQPVEMDIPVVSREGTEMYDGIAEAPAA